MKQQILVSVCCALLIILCGCVSTTPLPDSQMPDKDETPSFGAAVWVPYMEVGELLASGDAAAARQAIADVMEDCAARGLDTVYFHVRAHSDAYYASSVFPMHPAAEAVLAQGLDPLACAVEEAHSRGLSLHAWVNPYRIGSDISSARCADTFSYNERWYYVPTSHEAQALIVSGVRELVEGYAIDGVQFDDYFYPEGAVTDGTPSAFETDDFAEVTDRTVADWRRDAVSELVKQVCAVCHEREGCVFGVSPSYDIVRNRDKMYADVALWAREAGYVDYLCPQLYVGFQNSAAPFEQAMTAWTTLTRDASVSLIGGLAFYKTGMPEDSYAGAGATEWATGGDILARQTARLRETGWQGIALYSHPTLTCDGERNAAVVDAEWATLAKELG